MAPWEDYLKTIYYEPKHAAGFAGPQKLYKMVKDEGKFNIGMHKIRKFLQIKNPAVFTNQSEGDFKEIM